MVMIMKTNRKSKLLLGALLYVQKIETKLESINTSISDYWETESEIKK
jgi:hypothetical protein